MKEFKDHLRDADRMYWRAMEWWVIAFMNEPLKVRLRACRIMAEFQYAMDAIALEANS